MEFVQGFLGTAAKEGPEKTTTAVKDRKRSYITLLCNDTYYNGVQVLVKTIKKHCSGSYPITVVVDKVNVSQTTIIRLKKLVDMVIEVDPLYHNQNKESANAIEKEEGGCWAASEMTKLRLWSLIQFDQLVYVDADCMVLESIDELFDKCSDIPFAAAPDVFPPDKFNAGVLVLKPDQAIFDDICRKLPDLKSYDDGDTGVLNAYFPDWYRGCAASRLSFGYNMQRTLYWFTYKKRPGYWDSIMPKKIVHFSSSPKPWDSTMATASGDLEFRWWQELMS